MANSILVVVGVIALVIIVFGFVGYVVVTTHIIQGQEKEIADLQSQLKYSELKRGIWRP